MKLLLRETRCYDGEWLSPSYPSLQIGGPAHTSAPSKPKTTAFLKRRLERHGQPTGGRFRGK
jgi:hypothetical protein